MLTVSQHAEKRVHKRLGVPKKSVFALIEQAEENGTRRKDVSGSLRRYLDYLVKKEGGNATDAIVWRGYVFLLRYDHLITAWLLPERYKNRKAAA